MSFEDEQAVETAKFSEVLETKIEAKEGPFDEPHPFLRTACRGLAKRLNPELVPMGFALATELYLSDMASGTDGFTGEPMPNEVTGMPPVMNGIVRLTAIEIAKEAFGEDFANAVKQHYEAIHSTSLY